MTPHHVLFILIVSLFVSGCTTRSIVIIQLDTLDKDSRKVELFKKLANDWVSINSAKQLLPYLDWLQSKTYSGVSSDNETFRYAMTYSFYLSKVQADDLAEPMMLYGQLRLETDFSRCKNKNNSSSKYYGWYQGGKFGSRILKNHKARDSKTRLSSLNLAVALEEQHRNRPGDKWLCSSINWTKALTQSDTLEQKEVANSEYVGRVIEVTPTKNILFKASFIPDDVWLENRSKIRKKFRETYE